MSRKISDRTAYFESLKGKTLTVRFAWDKRHKWYEITGTCDGECNGKLVLTAHTPKIRTVHLPGCKIEAIEILAQHTDDV